MDPNVIATIGGIVVIIIGVLRISSQLNTLSGDIKALNARVDGIEKHLNARIDGIADRLGGLEREVHSINELLRRPPQ